MAISYFSGQNIFEEIPSVPALEGSADDIEFLLNLSFPAV